MESTLALGIDPSWKTGSLTLGRISARGTHVMQACAMPDDEELCADLISSMLADVTHTFIEDIPRFAGVNRSASHMAPLQTNYGFLAGCILTHGGSELIRFNPMKWMNLIGFRDRPRDRTQRKRMLHDMCREKFPLRVWSLDMADSPLILEAGREFLRSKNYFTIAE